MSKIIQTTLIFVYLVILAGSVVRSSGAGMGCPDWPKCFGTWVPPTHVSQLPADYKQRYAEEHNAVQDFNPVQTWTEYVNRLLGAVLGVLIIIQLVFAFRFRRQNGWLLPLAFVMLITVGFQGWLGARVVASNLAPLKITLHMVGALVLLFLGIFLLYQYKKPAPMRIGKLALWVWAALAITLVQFFLGVGVRQEVDVWLDSMSRIEMMQPLHNSFQFITHARFSIAVLLLNVWILMQLWKMRLTPNLQKIRFSWAFLIGFELLIGLTLSWFDFPAFAQPLHLLAACLLFGTQLWMALHFKKA